MSAESRSDESAARDRRTWSERRREPDRFALVLTLLVSAYILSALVLDEWVQILVAVLYVGDEGEKQALLLGEPDIFFTAAEYGSWPLVLVRLARVDDGRLAELVTDAWRMRAPAALAAQFDDA